ncbi:HD-GYP domain-containing protein [Vibrio sp. 10N.239.312.D08]|uniref:HD-GYP domain-containing protein n=1 Tax=Vibrio sp. 10N.239.312.D08 TaxID=3229978 RepID=UPI0035504633
MNNNYEIFGVNIKTDDYQAIEHIENVVFKLLFGFTSFCEVDISGSIADHNYRCLKIANILLENLNYNALPEEDRMLFKASPKVVKYLSYACALHDLGKAVVPVQILIKPSSLTDHELAVMKEHTTKPDLDFFMNAGLDGNLFVTIMRDCIRSHHENFNGENGYPDGIKGVSIPFAGRLMRVIDVLDNLLRKSTYSDALSFEEAFQEIIKLNGVLFDPNIIDALIRSKELIRQTVE